MYVWVVKLGKLDNIEVAWHIYHPKGGYHLSIISWSNPETPYDQPAGSLATVPPWVGAWSVVWWLTQSPHFCDHDNVVTTDNLLDEQVILYSVYIFCIHIYQHIVTKKRNIAQLNPNICPSGFSQSRPNTVLFVGIFMVIHWWYNGNWSSIFNTEGNVNHRLLGFDINNSSWITGSVQVSPPMRYLDAKMTMAYSGQLLGSFQLCLTKW